MDEALLRLELFELQAGEKKRFRGERAAEWMSRQIRLLPCSSPPSPTRPSSSSLPPSRLQLARLALTCQRGCRATRRADLKLAAAARWGRRQESLHSAEGQRWRGGREAEWEAACEWPLPRFDSCSHVAHTLLRSLLLINTAARFDATKPRREEEALHCCDRTNTSSSSSSSTRDAIRTIEQAERQ